MDVLRVPIDTIFLQGSLRVKPIEIDSRVPIKNCGNDVPFGAFLPGIASRGEHHEGKSTDREFSHSLASGDGRRRYPLVAGDRVPLCDHNRNGGGKRDSPNDRSRTILDLSRDVTVNRVSALWAVVQREIPVTSVTQRR